MSSEVRRVDSNVVEELRQAGFENDELNPEVQERIFRTLFEHPPRGDYLLSNPLSRYWKWSYLRQNPQQIPYTIGMIPFGMVGYALSLPVRITIFVIELVRLISAILSYIFQNNSRQTSVTKRFLMTVAATGELISGIIGCALPPLAYKCDEWIQSHREIHRNYLISRWNSEIPREEAPFIIENRRENANGFQDLLYSLAVALSLRTAEQQRIQNLQKRVQLIALDKQTFVDVKDELATYLHEDLVDPGEQRTLNFIAYLTFLRLFLDGKDLSYYLRCLESGNLEARHLLQTLQSQKENLTKAFKEDDLYKCVLSKFLLEEEDALAVTEVSDRKSRLLQIEATKNHIEKHKNERDYQASVVWHRKKLEELQQIEDEENPSILQPDKGKKLRYRLSSIQPNQLSDLDKFCKTLKKFSQTLLTVDRNFLPAMREVIFKPS